MVEEGEWHRQTREKIMTFLQSKNLKFLHDHGEGGRPLRLFKTDDSGKVHLSDADILVFGDDVTIVHIVEVMGGNTTPKSMVGIAGATALCNAFVDSDGNRHSLRKPMLWIVLDSKKVRDKGPRKHDRMESILRELQRFDKPLVRLDNLAGVRICYDDTFEREYSAF
jgi:hypothetical protein